MQLRFLAPSEPLPWPEALRLALCLVFAMLWSLALLVVNVNAQRTALVDPQILPEVRQRIPEASWKPLGRSEREREPPGRALLPRGSCRWRPPPRMTSPLQKRFARP